MCQAGLFPTDVVWQGGRKRETGRLTNCFFVIYKKASSCDSKVIVVATFPWKTEWNCVTSLKYQSPMINNSRTYEDIII
jgi:hypothetical protein